MERLKEIQMEIHRLLIESTDIANEEEKILSAHVRVEYLSPTGNVGCNVILNCDLKLEEK